MTREIKFRAYDANASVMRDWAWCCRNLPMTSLSTEEDGFFKQQFTGLLDKNGTEIFEGDIISVASQIVSSNDPSPGTRMICADPDSKQLTDAFMDGNCRTSGFVFGERAAKLHYEVIGNIYENPDLLP